HQPLPLGLGVRLMAVEEDVEGGVPAEIVDVHGGVDPTEPGIKGIERALGFDGHGANLETGILCAKQGSGRAPARRRLSQAPAPPKIPTSPAMQPTLLIHSRQAKARRLLRLFLESSGFGCREVADGDALLSAVRSPLPCVVVVDARAPDEEVLLLLGLLGRRHPGVMRLVLHEGGARLHTASGAEERA